MRRQSVWLYFPQRMSSLTDYRSKVLITASELSEQLKSSHPPVVLAVRNDSSASVDRFAGTARIPGAQDIDLQTHLASPQTPTSGTRPLPDVASLQGHAKRWGIHQNSHVVVYDHDRGLQACRAWWVLRWAGLGQVRLLDGGFAAWQTLGLPLTTEMPSVTPGEVRLSAGHLPVLDADQAAQLARTGVLLDSRIKPNYIGGVTAPGQPARGHIPGAISAPAADNLTDPGTFTDDDTLRQLYEGLGVSAQRTTGVYCGAGISAAHVVLALQCIGVEAAMYPGSWSAWSSHVERPVTRGFKPG